MLLYDAVVVDAVGNVGYPVPLVVDVVVFRLSSSLC